MHASYGGGGSSEGKNVDGWLGGIGGGSLLRKYPLGGDTVATTSTGGAVGAYGGGRGKLGDEGSIKVS